MAYFTQEILPLIETEMQAVVDASVDGIILTDARGRVGLFSPACERMFGYSAAEILGGDIQRLLASPCRDQPGPRLGDFMTTAQSAIAGLAHEAIGLRRTGEAFPLDLSVSQGGGGEDLFFIGVLRDATLRKRAESEREHLIEQLRAAHEERTSFARTAVHDLRQPLQMVSAFCARLLASYGDRLDERGRDYLSFSAGAAKQMNRLLDDLVAFDGLRADADRLWFAANESLEQALTNLDEDIRRSGAQVTADSLPQIYGDPVRFRRLIETLLANALTYIEPGAAPRVHVRATRDAPFWRFSVSDNGIGVEPRHYAQIFEPFKRLHPPSRYPGSGLGLAIGRKIVEGFGGEIGVGPAEGQGSIFTFTVRDPPGGDNLCAT